MAFFTAAGVAAGLASAGIGVSGVFATPSVYVIKQKPKAKK
ncbi:MAG: hypothetical protein PGN20_01670 [Agrobacterium cavarae]